MKGTMLSTALVLILPSLAMAHVSVRPRESRPGAEEQYTVRVPTEGAVATTYVRLDIPPDVTVLEVLSADGATIETVEQADRISAITWEKDIPPKQFAEFVFRARNPASGDIVWKAHQHFADGTVAAWVGPAGDRRPAAVTRLTGGSGAAAVQPAPDSRITASLKGYDTNARANHRRFVGGELVTGPVVDRNSLVKADLRYLCRACALVDEPAFDRSDSRRVQCNCRRARCLYRAPSTRSRAYVAPTGVLADQLEALENRFKGPDLGSRS